MALPSLPLPAVIPSMHDYCIDDYIFDKEKKNPIPIRDQKADVPNCRFLCLATAVEYGIYLNYKEVNVLKIKENTYEDIVRSHPVIEGRPRIQQARSLVLECFRNEKYTFEIITPPLNGKVHFDYLKENFLEYGPPMISIVHDDEISKVKGTDSIPVIPPIPILRPDGIERHHAVLMIGWKKLNGEDYIIVRDNKGKEWGKDGLALVGVNSLRKPGHFETYFVGKFRSRSSVADA